MASTTRKWLTGCGIGCALILLIIGAIGTSCYFGVKRMVEEVDDLEAEYAVLSAEFGEPEEFTPAPDGRIPAQRLEKFLAVRDRMTQTRQEMSGLFTALEGRGAGGVIAKVKAGLRLLPAIFEFIAERNRALLDEGMGLGEYQYIYCLAYYVYLDKDVADGPGFSILSDDHEHGDHRVRWRGSVGKGDGGDVRYEREKDLRRVINDVQKKILINQLAAADTLLTSDQDTRIWRKQLAAEVEAMHEGRLRIPWEDGLPDRIRESLVLYRTELQDSYDPQTNVLEMGLIDED